MKTRAWNTISKEWIKEGAKNLTYFYIEPEGRVVAGNNSCEIYPDPAKVIVTYCTDLKDKNGKEIYEKDIIRCNYYKSDYTEHILIIYDKLQAAFGVLKDTHFSSFSWMKEEGQGPSELEVIGNIYENPELLIDK